MKKLFSKSELLTRRGCYSRERIEEIFPNQYQISIKEILSVESVNIKDKRWFVYNSCELTLDEKKDLCVILVYIVLPIYENKYPNDLRVRECLESIQLFKDGKITIDELKKKRDAAAAAAAYAAAADAAAYAAAADAAAAYAAADAAADAADAAGKQIYSERILIALLNFFEL